MTRPRSYSLRRASLYGAAVVLALWVLVPIYLITVAAFSTQNAVYSYPKQLLPQSVSLSTMRYFLDSAGVVGSLERSILVAAVTLVAALIIGTPAGYALARFTFPGANAFRVAILTTRAFPIVILAIPLTVTFIQWGLEDTVYGVAFVHAALAIPFVVLVTAGVFSSISVELEEAAMTLGCTRRSAFQKVILPLARPGLMAAAIFTFIVSWNEVFAAAILTLRNRTLPAQILAVLNSSPLPYKFAGGFFMLAPAFLVIFFSRKYLFNTFAGVEEAH
jgi:multiple sugar transport system permease protein